MATHRNYEDLPEDEHLRGDISIPPPDTGSEDEHLADDVNLPPGEAPDGVEAENRPYLPGQLNAGQHAAGLGPDGEYARIREDELES